MCTKMLVLCRYTVIKYQQRQKRTQDQSVAL